MVLGCSVLCCLNLFRKFEVAWSCTFFLLIKLFKFVSTCCMMFQCALYVVLDGFLVAMCCYRMMFWINFQKMLSLVFGCFGLSWEDV